MSFIDTPEFLAGGTDLLERRRSRVARGMVVPLEPPIHILWQDDGAAHIGAGISIDALSKNEDIKKHYSGLAQAAYGLATPQIRNMATLGGCLTQHTRCTYYRHPDFDCFKKGGQTCPSRTGSHQLGVVFDLGDCVYPHPSTLGMALLAFEAKLELASGQVMPIEALYGDGSDARRDHQLEPDQIIEQILLPAPIPNEQTRYVRAISRFEAEWALVEVLVRLQVQDKQICLAKVAVGGVANVPLRLPKVEQALLQQPANQNTLKQAANLATDGVRPLPQTAYKVPLLRNAVLEGLELALAQ
jgi:xanthine dehydrogenase YagS FAD-binding subunit